MHNRQPLPIPRHPQKRHIPHHTKRSTHTALTPKNRRLNTPRRTHRPTNMDTNPKKTPNKQTASRHNHKQNQLRSTNKNKSKRNQNLRSRRTRKTHIRNNPQQQTHLRFRRPRRLTQKSRRLRTTIRRKNITWKTALPSSIMHNNPKLPARQSSKTLRTANQYSGTTSL